MIRVVSGMGLVPVEEICSRIATGQDARVHLWRVAGEDTRVRLWRVAGEDTHLHLRRAAGQVTTLEDRCRPGMGWRVRCNLRHRRRVGGVHAVALIGT